MSTQDIQAIQDVQHKISNSVAQAETEENQLSNEGAGTDPDYAKTNEHFASMTHEQIYIAVFGRSDGSGGMDVRRLRQLQQDWLDAASALENLSTFNLLGMNNIFNHGLWQGVSGSAAQAAAERIAHAANQIGQVFEVVSQRLDSIAWAADAIRRAVPPVPAGAATVATNPDNAAESIVPGLINPAYADRIESQRKSARDLAVYVMQTLYTPSFPPAGAGVPAYSQAPRVGGTDPGTTNPGVSNTSRVTTSAEDTRRNPGPNAQKPDASDHEPTRPTAADPDSSKSDGTTPAEPSRPSTPGDTITPATTTAAGFGPGTDVSSGPGAAAAGDSLSLGPGSATGGGPGEAQPSTASAARSNRTPAATARPAQVPTSMAPHVGKHGDKTEEDREHYSPDYLRAVQPDWTAGLEPPVEVIGADFIAADPYSHTQGAQASEAMRAQCPPEPGSTTAPETNPELTGLFIEYGWGAGPNEETDRSRANSGDATGKQPGADQ
ncbi:hypothetical protein K7711_18895 [Nocardia sp. CA2R105]|uniref:hypothetical protein n=1 Tax=Nocardia coffeae TaxID=2873381 RepID=UPI001CA765D7|nr:hypothetical protein [Nocardia coffeae]MBY8858554.1 hypothetical protein [Nocardia coffeae]